MLDLMRKHAQSWLIKAALFGIIVTFVLWYGWPGQHEQRKDYVAKVNSTVISYDQYRTVYETELEKIRMRFKGTVPPELMEKLNLKKGILQALINRTLLLEEAQKLGLRVTDQDVVDDIKASPMFQRDGYFDESLYRAYVGSLRLSPTGFESARKQEILEQQIVDLLTDSVKTNPDEIKKFWHFQTDKLTLSALVVPIVQLQQNTAVDQKDLEAFYKENQQKYEIPQTLGIDYVAFSWREMQKDIQIPEDEVKAYYTSNPKEFVTPEQIRISHILLKFPEDADDEKKNEIKAKAAEIRKRAAAGEDFAELAKKESQDTASAEKGGDLGFISKGSVNPSIERAASQLEPGAISEPIYLENGYDIIKVVEKKPETQISFAEAAPKITQKLLEERAKKKVTGTADEFYEKVYRSDDLAGTAKSYDIDVQQAQVTKNTGIPGLGSDPKVMDEIFSLKVGDISKMLRSGDYYVVVKLVDRKKERIPNLDEIKTAVEQDYLKDLSLKETQKKAAQIIEELKQNSDFEAVAKKNGLSWEQLEPVTRLTNFIPKIGSGPAVQEMLTTISDANPLYPTPIMSSDGSAIVRLVKTDQASEEQFAKDAQSIEKWVLDVRKAEFLKGWLKILEEKASIDVNDKNL